MIAVRADIRRAAGTAIFCGFHGTSVSSEVREILREVRPAGLVLFARNVESPLQVAELCRELKGLRSDQPLLISVDQEGGRVARIREPATEWPCMRDIGRLADAELAYDLGAGLARELRSMNIDVDLAPVLDVDTNPDNPVIADRAFCSTPARVAELGVALARGLEDNGVAACGKHFPGHGDTTVDSHLALPVVEHELGRLREVEWVPFKAAVDAGIGALMTAHVVVSCLDETHPATLSAASLAPLRDELGFQGVLVSDDLEMKAVADAYTPEQMSVRGFEAGIHLFLACQDPAFILKLYRGIVVGAEQGQIAHDTLLAAESRVTAWRRRFYRSPEPLERLDQSGIFTRNRALVQAMRERLSRG